MPMKVRLEPVRIRGVEDGDGALVFWGDALAVVLVRLSDDHGDVTGHWFVEKGFGTLDSPTHPVFETLEAAAIWVAGELGARDVSNDR
jgi:hypothetical protein